MFDKNKIDDFFNQSKEIKKKQRTLSEKLRIYLPLLACVLLCLFLIPMMEDDEDSFAFKITTPKKGEIEKLMVENLDFYITDKNNIIHNFKAKNIAEIDEKNKITQLDDLDGVFNNGNDNWLSLKSNVGYFYQNENILKLPNIADMFYTQGFEMNATDVVVDFKTNKIYSNTPTYGDGFLGQTNADGFEIDMKTGVLTFIGNVKIIKREGE